MLDPVENFFLEGCVSQFTLRMLPYNRKVQGEPQ